MIIQTHNPDHKLLQIILQKGYEKFSEEAMKQRKSVNLPPYSHISIIKVSSINKRYSKSILKNIKENKTEKDIFIYGPYQSKISKINNKDTYQLLVGSNSTKLLSEHIHKIEIYLSSLTKKIKWHVDVDPLEL